MNIQTIRIITAAVVGLNLSLTAQAQDTKINFEDHIKPIFRAKCLSCHNTNKKTADLDLSSYTAMMQGGGSGESVAAGSPDDSYLFMLINHDSEPYMPPNSDKIPDEMIQTVRKWIEAGAPETSSSKVMLPKKQNVNMSVDVAAGARPEGPPPLPDVLNLEPVVHTAATTAVSAIATSPWAKLVAVAGQKQVVLYSSETLQPLGVLPFPEGQAKVLKFSRNGALLLAGGGQGAARGLAVVWDIKSGKRIMEVGDELDEVLAADISADQSMVAVGGPGKIVRVYSTSTGEQAYEIVKHTDWISSLEFSPDSILLASSDRAGGLHVWESFTGREYLTLNGHKGGVHAVSWRIDSNVLASASADASVKLWELENGKNIKSWSAHGGGVLSMEFCRDGRVVTSGRDKTAKIWDQNGKQLIAFEAFSDLALQVSHCDETNRVIAGDWTGEVRVWKAEDGARVGNLTTNPPMLQARLRQAEAKIAPTNQKLEAARTAFAAATAAKTAHVQKIEIAKQAYATAQKTLSDRQAALKTQEAQLAVNQKTLTASQQRLAALKKAVPDLTAAAAKATEAATMMSEDPALKKVSDGLNAQVTQRTSELKETDAAVKASVAEVAKFTQMVAATKKQIVADGQQVPVQKTNMDKQIAAVKPFDEALVAAQNGVNASQNGVNAVAAEVTRWKEYIALREELKLLAQKEAEKDQVHIASLEADAMLNEKQQQVAAAQQQVQAKTQLIAGSQKKVTDLNAVITASTTQQKSMQDMATRHEKVIPVLQSAIAQAKAASGMLPTDAAIKNSVTALEQAAAAKTAGLATLKQQVTTVIKTITDSRAVVAATTAEITAAKTAMTDAQEAMKKLTAEAAPMEKLAQEAKAKLAAAEAEFAKVEAIVEARKEKLRPQLQVTQAAR